MKKKTLLYWLVGIGIIGPLSGILFCLIGFAVIPACGMDYFGLGERLHDLHYLVAWLFSPIYIAAINYLVLRRIYVRCSVVFDLLFGFCALVFGLTDCYFGAYIGHLLDKFGWIGKRLFWDC